LKAIILAAGQGTRLRPLTNSKPKCMVKYKNKPIINYILDTMKECKIKDIAVVDGYKKSILENYLQEENITFFTNSEFNTTNMVTTLFKAKEFMNDDIIISYADIIYTKEILEKLMNSNDDLNVVVDKNWKELWSIRMENPLDDAETLKIKDGNIVELGKRPKNYNDIDGQYIGLIKITKSIIPKLIDFYELLDKNILYDGKDYDNMYMTSLLQLFIDNMINVKPVFIFGGWIEIDSLQDLNNYEQYLKF